MSRDRMRLQSWLCVVLVVLLPASLIAQDTQGAMLESKGSVSVNGRPAPNSQAIFPGDLVVTEADGGANVTLNGTNLVVVGAAAARYDVNAAALERGGITVRTSKGFEVHVGFLTVTPKVVDQWTAYSVTTSEAGRVTIQSTENSVNVTEGNKTETVDQGHESNRDRCLAAAVRRTPGAATAASSGPLNSTTALAIGSGVVGGVIILVLVKGHDPVTPKVP